jgi:capsular polysaccharide biosynthesis protein
METEEKSFNLKETVDSVKKYWNVLWKRKFWIIGIAALISGLFLLQAFMTPKTYPARLTFMVNDDEGNGLSGMGAILGELGFGSKKGGHNYEKIAEIALSRKILSTVLMESATFRGKTDFIGNHLIDVYGFHEQWEADTILSNFRFSNDTLTDVRALRQRDVANEKVAKFLRGNPEAGVPGVFSVNYDEESTILTITAASWSEELSIILSNAHYEKLSDFYIEKSIERQRMTYEHVKNKADSIGNALRNAESGLAGFKDKTHGMILNTPSLPKQQLSRKVEMLYMMYGEAVKNLETSEFLLKNSTPYFQVIDQPVGPIQPMGKSKKIAIIKGGLIGGILGVLFFVGRVWWREQLAG